MRKKKDGDKVDPFLHDMAILKRLALETIEQHEADAHGGERCESERINMIAYLAVAVGLGPGHIFLMMGRMKHFGGAVMPTLKIVAPDKAVAISQDAEAEAIRELGRMGELAPEIEVELEDGTHFEI